MQVIRQGVAVEVSKKDMTPEEVRAYNAKRKREQRARDKQEAEPTDALTLGFLNLLPADKRAFLRVHPRILQIEFERMKKFVKDAFVQEGRDDEPNEDVLHREMVQHHGFTAAELAELLDGTRQN